MDARAVDLAIFKKNSDPHIVKICGGGSRAHGSRSRSDLKMSNN